MQTRVIKGIGTYAIGSLDILTVVLLRFRKKHCRGYTERERCCKLGEVSSLMGKRCSDIDYICFIQREGLRVSMTKRPS